MKTKTDDNVRLAEDIEAADKKLEQLEVEIDEIGAPASYALRKRLDALKVEDHALHRNLSEAEAQPGPRRKARRMRKVEALLHHIEAEETSLGHDADFLHMASPTTLELTFRGGVRLLDPVVRKWKEFKGNRQWMWHSPFVNHTHRDLAERFDFPRKKR